MRSEFMKICCMLQLTCIQMQDILLGQINQFFGPRQSESCNAVDIDKNLPAIIFAIMILRDALQVEICSSIRI